MPAKRAYRAEMDEAYIMSEFGKFSNIPVVSALSLNFYAPS